MTGTSYIQKIYKENPLVLEYLRFNPRWYKILDEDPSKLDVFLSEAKTSKKIRAIDKLEELKDQISFIKQLASIL